MRQLVIPLLELAVPFLLGLAVVVIRARRGDAGLAAIVPTLRYVVPAIVVVVTALNLLIPGASLIRWVELQLLWLAPSTFWVGLAWLGRRRGRKRPRSQRAHLIRGVIGFTSLFLFGVFLSWFTSLSVLQMLLMAPRALPWSGGTPAPIGEWIEATLPALTTFHGRMASWGANRLVLLALGLAVGWLAWRRNPHPTAQPQLRRRLQLGIPLGVAAAFGVLALFNPSDPMQWRLGWSEGRIAVPVSAEDPDGPTIQVSYLIHPATGSSKADGVVVGAIGGPSAASQSRTELLGALADVNERNDVLISDYRGFGRSTPVQCDGVVQGPSAPEAIAACAENPLSEALSTRHAADDLELIRTALGVDSWSVYGQSYGTYFAQVYAQTYPDAVNSVVLDSTLTLTGVQEEALFMAPLAHGSAEGEPWSHVVEQARAQEWTSPSVQDLATIHLYSMWPEIGSARAAALELPADEAQGALAKLSESLNEELSVMLGDPLLLLMPATPIIPYACSDWVDPLLSSRDEEQAVAAVREHTRTHFGENIAPFTWDEINEASTAAVGLGLDTLRYEACALWPSDGGESAPIEAAHTEAADLPDVPVLVVSGDQDFSTTPRIAAQVAADWAGHLLTVLGGDHFVLADPAAVCARDQVAELFADPEAYHPKQCSTGP